MKRFIEKFNLPKERYFILFLFLNPFIDLITSLTIYTFKINFTFGMIIRFLFLFLMVYYLIFKSNNKYKKFNLGYLLLIIVFFILHLLNMYNIKDIHVLIGEIKILLKIIYFPVLLLAIFNYFYDEKIKINHNIFNIISIIYLAFILIPIITNTSFETYLSGKIGYIGWFNSPNEVGAILAVLSPFIISKIFNNFNKIYSYILFAIYVFIMLKIGTKVPFFGILLTVFTYFLIYVLRFILNKKKDFLSFLKRPFFLPVMVSIIIMILLYTVSTLNFNLNFHKESLQSKPDSTEKLTVDDYKNLIFSSRDVYNDIMQKKFKLVSSTEQLFGLGYKDVNNLFNKAFNIVEIDYIDIFYMYGILGFIIIFCFFISLLLNIFLKSIKRIKLIIYNEELIPYYISIVLILGIAFFAGHIFTAPAVSIYPIVIILFLHFKIKDYEKENINENNIVNKFTCFFKKYVVQIFGIISLMLVIVFGLSIKSCKVYNLVLYINDNQFVDQPNLEMINSINIKDDYDINVNDKLYEYNYLNNKVFLKIYLVERTIEDSKDKFLMFTINNLSNNKVDLKIVYQDISTEEEVQFLYSFKNDEIVKEYNSTVGEDKTTLPVNYIEYIDGNSILTSKGFIYKNLTKDYDNNENSKIKELVSENDNVYIDSNNFVHDFILDGFENYDTYFLLSDNKLFKNQKSIDIYIDMLNSAKYTSWLSFDGSYHKLPYSIEPFTRDGYGKNPGAVIGKQAFYNYKLDQSNIFYDFTINSNHYLLKYMYRNNNGVWFTEYTSTWLKKDYDIRAPYIDTRHNEGIGDYFNNIGDYFNNNKLKDTYLCYSNYLLQKYNENNVVRFKEGILLPDYFSYNHQKNTHSSLNHQLAIINYLLNSFIITNKLEYKNMAVLMLDTIEKQSEKWIRDDKDLWYQINENNEFDGRDYKTLTLEDLLYTQKYLILSGEKKSEQITKLIKSKYSYLKDINYNIPKSIIEAVERGSY